MAFSYLVVVVFVYVVKSGVVSQYVPLNMPTIKLARWKMSRWKGGNRAMDRTRPTCNILVGCPHNSTVRRAVLERKANKPKNATGAVAMAL